LDEALRSEAVDELISQNWKAAQPGHDPLRLGVPAKGTADSTLLRWAIRRRLCFITKDRGFGLGRSVPRRHWGIVILFCDEGQERDLVGRLGLSAKRPELSSALRDWRFALSGDFELATIQPDGTPREIWQL
jgi:hypothetical protein